MNLDHLDEVLARHYFVRAVSNTRVSYSVYSHEHGYRVIYWDKDVVVPGYSAGKWCVITREEAEDFFTRLGGINWRLTYMAAHDL